MADAFGNVYLTGGGVLTQFDLQGNVRQTFNIAAVGFQVEMDLAPDECTMYFTVYDAAPGHFGGPFNVCTDTQAFTPSWQYYDDLRVLPDWGIIVLGDISAFLSNVVSGGATQQYTPPNASGIANEFRTMALDPDGTSFWACCNLDLSGDPSVVPSFDIWRFDIRTGQVVARWPISGVGLGASYGTLAVYSPPLLGDPNVEGSIDSGSAGTAEAFQTTVGYSGQLTRLHLWIDSSSTASQAVVGIYSDRNGRPGSLIEQGTITNIRPGSWNYSNLPAMPVTAGEKYWVAVLAPNGDGTLSFRDAGAGGQSETSGQPNLTALPTHWSGAAHAAASGPISGYGS
ncbi:MAG: choice-of-anchor R domain-containing protein [Solirubrobacteraceae bacterium]